MEAEAVARRALEIYERAIGPQHPVLARGIEFLAEIQMRQGRWDEAEKELRRALAMRERVLPQGHPQFATNYLHLSAAALGQRHADEALRDANQAIALAERAGAEGRPLLPAAVRAQARALDALGRVDQANAAFQRFVSVTGDQFGPQHPNLSAALSDYATFLRARDRHAEALVVAEQLVGIFERQPQPPPPPGHYAAALAMLGAAQVHQGNDAEAERRFAQAEAQLERMPAKPAGWVFFLARERASLLMSKGRVVEARPIAEELVRQAKTPGALAPREAAAAYVLAGRIAREGGRYAEVEDLMQRAGGIFEKIPEASADFAWALSEVAMARYFLGRVGEAEPLYRRIRTILDAPGFPESSSAALANATAGTLARELGQPKAAREHYARSLAMYEKALGANHPFLRPALGNLIELEEFLGNYDRAEALLARAKAIKGAAAASDAHLLGVAAKIDTARGRKDQALRNARAAVAQSERIFGPEHDEVAATLNILAWTLQADGQLDAAIEAADRSIRIREKTLGVKHPRLAMSWDMSARLRFRKGEFELAESGYAKAQAIRQASLVPEHAMQAVSLSNLAILAASRGRFAEAEPFARKALAIRDRAFVAGDLPLMESIELLANLAAIRGRYAEAETLTVRLETMLKERPGTDVAALALAALARASLLRGRGDMIAAEPHLKRALEIAEKRFGGTHLLVWQILFLQSASHAELGRAREAQQAAERALGIIQLLVGPDHPLAAQTRVNVAMGYALAGRKAESKAMLKDALVTLEQTLGPDHLGLLRVLDGLVWVFWEAGDAKRALAYQLRVRDIIVKAVEPGHAHLGIVELNLSMIYDRLGDRENQRRARQRAQAILGSLPAGERPKLVPLPRLPQPAQTEL